MEELVAAGEARPLFEEFDVGPTFYQGIWWVVPDGEWDQGFTTAAQANQREFSATFLRLERASQIAAVGQYLDARRATRIAEVPHREIQDLREADDRADASAAQNARRAFLGRRPLDR